MLFYPSEYHTHRQPTAADYYRQQRERQIRLQMAAEEQERRRREAMCRAAEEEAWRRRVLAQEEAKRRQAEAAEQWRMRQLFAEEQELRRRRSLEEQWRRQRMFHQGRPESPQQSAEEIPYEPASPKSPEPSPASTPVTPTPTTTFSDSDREDAASKIQSLYRARVALRSLRSITHTIHSLKHTFTFPSVVDFIPPTSQTTDSSSVVSLPVPASASAAGANASSLSSGVEFEEELDNTNASVARLAYTPTNFALHSYIEALNKVLISLDAVESHGIRRVREARKVLVRLVEEEVQRVERICRQVWLESLRPSASIDNTAQAVERGEEAEEERPITTIDATITPTTPRGLGGASSASDTSSLPPSSSPSISSLGPILLPEASETPESASVLSPLACAPSMQSHSQTVCGMDSERDGMELDEDGTSGSDTQGLRVPVDTPVSSRAGAAEGDRADDSDDEVEAMVVVPTSQSPQAADVLEEETESEFFDADENMEDAWSWVSDW